MTLAAPPRRAAGAPRRILALTALLARPSRQGRAAIVLPVLAFAVTTALLLLVLGGTRMFLTDPRALDEYAAVYGPLSVFALVLLAVPTATLGAAAARLSARHRNDRLATLRLLGATSAEVGAITVIEAAATALAGALAGAVLYASLLPVAGLLPFFGVPVGPGALWAGAGLVATALAAVTVLATASAAVSLRRVQLTPLGVRRRTDAPPRRRWLIVLGALGLITVALVVANFSAFSELIAPALALTVLAGLFGAALLLVNVVGTPIIAARGRAMARSAATAAQLIAGRELAGHAAIAWRRVSGVAMIAFIAVIGGAGASLATIADTEGDVTIFDDVRTGVLLTLAIGFLLLACSVGVTQAASVLEERDLIVGLDRLGMPASELQKARRIAVMTPLRWAALGGAAAGGVLTLPIVGTTVFIAPVSLVIVAATFATGILVVRLSVRATTPLVTAIRRSG